MKIYIENISTFEKRNKVYTTQWMKIYKVIEPESLNKSDNFPNDFIKIYKDDANEAINIPIEEIK